MAARARMCEAEERRRVVGWNADVADVQRVDGDDVAVRAVPGRRRGSGEPGGAGGAGAGFRRIRI